MPRYFFDINDGDHSTRDDVGIELPDLQLARRKAIGVLPDLARDVLPDGDHHEITSMVRDDAGHVLLRATLSLSVERFSPPQT